MKLDVTHGWALSSVSTLARQAVLAGVISPDTEECLLSGFITREDEVRMLGEVRRALEVDRARGGAPRARIAADLVDAVSVLVLLQDELVEDVISFDHAIVSPGTST